MTPLERPSAIRAERKLFDRFAEASSRIVGQAAFFALAFAMIVVWMPLVVVFESIDTWQLVLNTLTSVVAFLLIALLQNSERRNDHALHIKLDTIAAALAVQLADRLNPDPKAVGRMVRELEAALNLEQQI